MTTEIYQSIITLSRLNIQLTEDAIRLLNALIQSFDTTFIQVNSIQELESKLRRIFPGPTSEKVIPQLHGVSRGYIGLENTLIEAKKITIRYVLTLILRTVASVKSGPIDGYDIATVIINDPILNPLHPALPKFPYGKVSTQTAQPLMAGNITILPGFLDATDDYLVALDKNFQNNPQGLIKLGSQFGFQVNPNDVLNDFNNKFRLMLIQRATTLGKPIIGFIDLINILLTFKR